MARQETRRSTATSKGEAHLAELAERYPDGRWHIEGATTFFGRAGAARICVERGLSATQWIVSRMGRDGSQTTYNAPSPLVALVRSGVMESPKNVNHRKEDMGDE